MLSLLLPPSFFQSSAFLLSGNSRAPSAELSHTCALERAAAPGAEGGSTWRAWTNAVILFYSKEGGHYPSAPEHDSTLGIAESNFGVCERRGGRVQMNAK